MFLEGIVDILFLAHALPVARHLLDEELLDLRDQAESLALELGRRFVLFVTDLPGSLLHQRLGLVEEIDDLGGRTVGDEFLDDFPDLGGKLTLLAGDALVFLDPHWVRSSQIGVGEKEVFLEQPQLDDLERGDDREEIIDAGAARDLLDIVAEGFHLDKLHGRHRGRERHGGDALGFEVIRHHVEGLGGDLIEEERGDHLAAARLFQGINRHRNAETGFPVDGNLKRKILQAAGGLGKSLEGHLLDGRSLCFRLGRFPRNGRLGSCWGWGRGGRGLGHRWFDPWLRPDDQGCKMGRDQEDDERAEHRQDAAGRAPGDMLEEVRGLFPLGLGDGIIGAAQGGNGLEAILRRERVVKLPGGLQKRASPEKPQPEAGDEQPGECSSPPDRQDAPFLDAREGGMTDPDDREKQGKAAGRDDQGPARSHPAILLMQEPSGGFAGSG